jgi:hypothetical protein
MNRWGILGVFPVLAVTAALLTACGGPSATASCDEAFKTLEAKVSRMSSASATAYTDAQWNALELGPLNACKDFGDWLNGAKDHPQAVGFTSADAVDIELLAIRCDITGALATRVCKDMDDLGLL